MMPPNVNAEEIGAVEDDQALWVARYKRALLSIEDRIPVNVRKILFGHYHAQNLRLSVLEMGQMAGYKGTRAGSLHYGKFAGMLSESMEFESPTADKISAIGEWDRTPDERGHGGWVMYRKLAVALEELGWVIPETAPKQEQDFSFVGLTTTRFAETILRVGQDIFRSELLSYWGGCAVTGCSVSQILIASHIVPWSEASNQERMDVYNGLLLTPNVDRLFDQYLISFDESGLIQIAPSLPGASLTALGINPQLRLSKVAPEHIPYLKRHLSHFRELQICSQNASSPDST